MPIRWRLTLWFALILCLILIFSGVVLYMLLQRYLSNEIDNSLRAYSAQMHGTLKPHELDEPLDYSVIHSRLPPINEFASPGIYIELIDKSGKVVVKSDTLGDLELPVNPMLLEKGFTGKVSIETVSAGDGARVRVMVSPLYLKDQTLVLEVAQSLSHLDSTMAQARLALLASILFALILATVAGGFLVRSTLSPVSRITHTARSIETSADLNRRVGYIGPQDEIGQLATTFDYMLEQLDKAFKSQRNFVADASHELRGPLTVIRGNLDLLKRNIPEADRRECLRAIASETNRMSKIVSSLLALAEVESLHESQRVTVNLKEILREELDRARTLAPKHQVLIGRQEDLPIKGDAQLIKQLLANLIDNAIRYTTEGGLITLSLFRDGVWARLEVADTGIGIPAEHLPYIFGRFYRVDKSRSRASGGTGLGLAIVKEIAEQHGGKVTVTSEPGKGSTFAVWFKL